MQFDRIHPRLRNLLALQCVAGCAIVLQFVSFLSGDELTARLGPHEPLTWEGDIASRLVDSVDAFLLQEIERSTAGRAQFWQRDFSSPKAYQQSIAPNRERLARRLGIREPREASLGFQFQSTTVRSSLVATSPQFDIHEVRWLAVGQVHGEGLLLQPRQEPVARVVVIPDSSQTPESLCGLDESIGVQQQVAALAGDALSSASV